MASPEVEEEHLPRYTFDFGRPSVFGSCLHAAAVAAAASAAAAFLFLSSLRSRLQIDISVVVDSLSQVWCLSRCDVPDAPDPAVPHAISRLYSIVLSIYDCEYHDGSKLSADAMPILSLHKSTPM